ncbi:CDP-diacylglycerol--glycerol-3-phosphate3-phosphatidyltransferase [Striga asiatica]|uniref:CDP-diacylglycerol--glycerol-3-phosphate3-phosphatidyltransferase n=1 Tax=Striga asiatica TaxID=4170 RepID=A0A5A7Q125_STRAF|nr:CDP-diacylglycerol--glycerol-3-phosphate3-phosphatidyltransferase [Striga asiatica]
MNCFAFAICFENKRLFSILYFISFVFDALDGWFARKLNQVSTFGAVLDMVTDRPGFIFLSLLALDIASHWLQMYSSFLVGKSSHKDVKDSTSWLFRLYYGNRKFMGYCCVSCEVLYIVLFLLGKNQPENISEVLVNAAMQSWLYFPLLSLTLIGWAIKQLVNVIQPLMHAFITTLISSGRKHWCIWLFLGTLAWTLAKLSCVLVLLIIETHLNRLGIATKMHDNMIYYKGIHMMCHSPNIRLEY